MADESPFSTDSLTIDYRSLLAIPVADRVQLLQNSPDITQQVLTNLTPIEVAKSFPSYYRDQLPDISNFVSANKYLDTGGQFHQESGGTQGTAQPLFDHATKLSPQAQPSAVKDILEKAGIAMPVETVGTATPEATKQYLLDAMNKQNINDPEIRSALAAVVQGESNFIPSSEKDYSGTSNERIRSVFGSRVAGLSDSELTNLKSNPEAFFNKVYDGKLGNANGEGFKYRGRGLIQLTGKANYAKYGGLIGVDLVNNPDLANDPKIAAQLAAAYINDRYESAPGQSKKEKVFRAVGNAVSGTEEVKDVSFENFMGSGEFAPGKEATIEEQAAAAVSKLETPAQAVEALAVNPALTEMLNSNEETKAFFDKHPDKLKELNAAISANKISIDEIKTKLDKVSSAIQTKNPANANETIANVSGDLSEDPYEFWKARNPNGAIIEHNGKAISREQLTTAMMAAKKFEAEHPDKRVEMYGPGAGYDVPGSPLGGSREGGSQHLKAGATDWAIYDVDPKTGEKLKIRSGAYGNYANKPNHGGVDPEGYSLYHEFAQNQELARVFKASQGEQGYSNWGVREGAFFSDVEWDVMHTDIGGSVNPETGISSHASPIGRGSVAGGYSEQALQQLGIDPNSEAGQKLMTGVAERFGTGEELVQSAVASYGKPIAPPKELPSNNSYMAEYTNPTAVNTTTAEPINVEPSKKLPSNNSYMSDYSSQQTATPAPKTTNTTASTPAPTTTSSEPAPKEEDAEKLPTTTPQFEGEIPKKALGGNMYGVSEDITLVDTKTGKSIAQVNDNETLEKTDTQLKVVPQSKATADQLTSKYEIDDNKQEEEPEKETKEEPKQQTKMTETKQKFKDVSDSAAQSNKILEKMIDATTNAQKKTGQMRAMARVKGLSEGFHFNRNSPNSKT